MDEVQAYGSVVKVVTKNFGMSNDPADAGDSYQVDFFAPADAHLILLEDSRYITIGNATFLVGMPVFKFNGVLYNVLHDADMDDETLESSQVWINTEDNISVVEEVGVPEN